jgi:exopolysaccharide biosynthesis polyprenyl glycosylphosphotransferase
MTGLVKEIVGAVDAERDVASTSLPTQSLLRRGEVSASAVRLTPRMSYEHTAGLPLGAPRSDSAFEQPAPRLPHTVWQALFAGPAWSGLCACVDFVLAAVAVFLALGTQPDTHQLSGERSMIIILPAIVVLQMVLRRGYRRRLRVLVLDALPSVVSAVSVAVMAVATLELLSDRQVTNQPAWVRVWLATVVMVCGGRLMLALAHRWAMSRRLVAKRVLILGAGRVGKQIARRLEAQPEYGLLPVGLLDDHPLAVAHGTGCGVPVIGSVADIEEAVRFTEAQGLIVAFSTSADARLSATVHRCQQLGVEVLVVPRMFDNMNHRMVYDAVGALPLFSLSAVDPKGWQFAVKHALDRVFAALLLICLAPLMLAIALAVRLTSPGPVLFRQLRVQRDGKVFALYKFRSMRWRETEPSRDEVAVARLLRADMGPGGLEGDKGLTPIGGILRRTSIDELPQLINVVKGDMSIVGPRPERPEFVELFARDIARYGERHRVKPGITGWAQVHGLRGPTSMLDRTEWDNYYITHWSLALDLRILLLTIVAIFGGR